MSQKGAFSGVLSHRLKYLLTKGPLLQCFPPSNISLMLPSLLLLSLSVILGGLLAPTPYLIHQDSTYTHTSLAHPSLASRLLGRICHSSSLLLLHTILALLPSSTPCIQPPISVAEWLSGDPPGAGCLPACGFCCGLCTMGYQSKCRFRNRSEKNSSLPTLKASRELKNWYFFP